MIVKMIGKKWRKIVGGLVLLHWRFGRCGQGSSQFWGCGVVTIY